MIRFRHDLELGEVWNLLYLSPKWCDCHETERKHIDWTLGLRWTIGFDLGHDIDLGFSRSNMKFTISQPKIVRLPRNKKGNFDWTLGLKCCHRVWPWPWHWPRIFKFKYWICYISAKMARLPRSEKPTYWLSSMPQTWPMGLNMAMTLTLNFQGKIWNLLYLMITWSDCHKKKNEHIDD